MEDTQLLNLKYKSFNKFNITNLSNLIIKDKTEISCLVMALLSKMYFYSYFQFQKRQMATSYDLSYNQHVPPQTQINSFYEPDVKNTARQFHKTSVSIHLFSFIRKTIKQTFHLSDRQRFQVRKRQVDLTNLILLHMIKII